MKKLIISIALALSALSAGAFDLKDVLKGAGGNSGDTGSSDIANAIGGIIGSVTSTTAFSVDDIVGTWEYSAPAVTFDSDDVLKKVGGAAASATLEGKIKPYYERFGLNNIVITVDAEHKFSMKLKYGTFTGTVEKDEDNFLVFKFKALGKISMGQLKAMASKSGTTLTLTFDISRVISVLEKVSEVAKNSTFKSATSLLSSYDGLYMGFKLKKQ